MFTSTDSIQELGLENIVYCLIWNQFVNISARTYHNYWNSDSSCISMGFNLLLDFRIYNEIMQIFVSFQKFLYL